MRARTSASQACGSSPLILAVSISVMARPSLAAHTCRTMELAAGRPQKKGNKRGASYAYNVKELRQREARIAKDADKSHEHFVTA